MWILVLIASVFVLPFIGEALGKWRAKKRRRAESLTEKESRLEQERVQFEKFKEESLLTVKQMAQEKSLGFPWLATAYAEYFKLFDLKLADALANKRPRPALKAAEAIRVIAKEKADLCRENRILRESYRYYENLFPWLIEFKGHDLDELIRQVNAPASGDDEEEDQSVQWLSEAERASPQLSRAEKFQRALDRYRKSKKPPWVIGRDYERYIGFLHERKGWNVEYHGIARGYDDLGRDLICVKELEVRIIQCKHWAFEKTVHEKHVCQIFGTTEAYKNRLIAQRSLFAEMKVTPWLYTSCSLSPTAKDFAKTLGVEYVENFPLTDYPIIKCNISPRDGTKIYHLPFDQQYDRTLIEFTGEQYVSTVAEAEALGFRRAFRWRGDTKKELPGSSVT